jgi:hypothetical protein
VIEFRVGVFMFECLVEILVCRLVVFYVEEDISPVEKMDCILRIQLYGVIIG